MKTRWQVGVCREFTAKRIFDLMRFQCSHAVPNTPGCWQWRCLESLQFSRRNDSSKTAQWLPFDSICVRPKTGCGKGATKWNKETGKFHLIENNDENGIEYGGKSQNMHTFDKTSASRTQHVQPFYYSLPFCHSLSSSVRFFIFFWLKWNPHQYFNHQIVVGSETSEKKNPNSFGNNTRAHACHDDDWLFVQITVIYFVRVSRC